MNRPAEYDDGYDDEPLASLPYAGLEEVDNPNAFRSMGDVLERLSRLMREKAKWLPLCESPIEVDLAAHLAPILPSRFGLEAQYPFLRYRMDFAVISSGNPRLFIECDGKEFHSTTAQQINDAAKDSAAARAGIPLLRLTGSTIFNYPEECARKIVEMLEGMA